MEACAKPRRLHDANLRSSNFILDRAFRVVHDLSQDYLCLALPSLCKMTMSSMSHRSLQQALASRPSLRAANEVYEMAVFTPLTGGMAWLACITWRQLGKKDAGASLEY